MRINAKDVTGLSQEDFQRYASQLIRDITDLVNGALTFSENLSTSLVSVTFTATATDTSVDHGLNRVPVGYIVVGRSAAMTVYDGSSVNSNTAKKIFLRTNATGTASVLVF